MQLNNSASNSVCLNEFHVYIVTCAVLNLDYFHRATLPGNTPCYSKLTVDKQMKMVTNQVCVLWVTLLWFESVWIGTYFRTKQTKH